MFGLCEEVKIPLGNPHSDEKTKKTPQAKASAGISRNVIMACLPNVAKLF